MTNGILTGTFVSLIIALPFLLFIACVIKGRNRSYNIYNRYNGECLASGFACEEDAEDWLRKHFIDDYSYRSVRCDFVIDQGTSEEQGTDVHQFPTHEDYCFDNPFFEEPEKIKPEDYTPITPYYKNRIAKYFDKQSR